MTKLIVFSDLHMTPNGQRIIGLDPYTRLVKGLRHVNKFHGDAAHVVFLGDLSHFGDRASYMRLKRALEQLRLPYSLMVGNHDDRALLREFFTGIMCDGSGYVQGTLDVDEHHRLILLDTINNPARPQTSIHAGFLCKARMAWLEAELARAGRRHVILFLHHPPHAVGFAGMDQVRLLNETAFYRLVARAGNVRHIFAGHVHRTISGSCRGIPFSIFKSPVHQQPMTFESLNSGLSVDEPAAYGIVFLQRESVLVHTEDYEISTGGAPGKPAIIAMNRLVHQRPWALRPALRYVLMLVHVTALVIMWRTETVPVGKAAFLLSWVMLNCLFLCLVRRPLLAAGLAMAFVLTLIRLSQIKHEIVFTTLVFVDVMIIDPDTFRFLATMQPTFKWGIGTGLAAVGGLVWALWRAEPRPWRRRIPALVGLASLGALTGLSLTSPAERWEVFYNGDYVSKFFRSSFEAGAAFLREGILESDVMAGDRLSAPLPCVPPQQRPHIILIHDESSFDARALPGLKVPPGYGPHFVSADGLSRTLLVESSGGASWFAEYNVLTGLSSRSFGSFSYFLTRIAGGRVERGLPRALVACGYRTTSLYPSPGGFMGARRFQETTGVQQFLDHATLGGRIVEPDAFYYGAAVRVLDAQRGRGPQFVFVYLAANHFPWDAPGLPEPELAWTQPGNAPLVDEYLRRQAASALHYQRFVDRLKQGFPGEPFLIVRYGDHQPSFTTALLRPELDEAGRRRAMATFDPRYFSTYYAIDTIGFVAADRGSARSVLDAPFLPLVILEAAGLPLDPSFAEQKRILARCNGLFYGCRGGAEASRFNRLLIDAGLIKGL